MLATFRNRWPLTTPTSIGRGSPETISCAAATGLGGNAQRLRQIIGGAERQDADRESCLDQCGCRGVQRAIATADDNQITTVRAVGNLLTDRSIRIARSYQLDAALAQRIQHIVDHAGTIARVAVDNKQSAAGVG